MNAIKLALLKSGVLNGKQFNRLSEEQEKEQSSWNASLSYRTYQALKAQGVME